MGLTGVRLCGAAAAPLGLGETMLHSESRCCTKNAAPGMFHVFDRHIAKLGSAENSRVPVAGWVLHYHWGCKAAGRGGKGFMAAQEHAALKFRVFLKHF